MDDSRNALWKELILSFLSFCACTRAVRCRDEWETFEACWRSGARAKR